MKKIFLPILAFLILSSNSFAQETAETFGKGDNVLGVGFGIGGVYGFSAYHSQTPTFGLQYDRGIIELGMGGVIGVGGFIGYKSVVYKYDYYFDDYKYKYNIFIIGARGTFHYDLFKVKKLDTYGGAMIAYHALSEPNVPNTPGFYYKSHRSAAYASLFAGAKYYFTPAVAAYAEVGYGVSWLTMGIAFKF